MLSVDPAIPQGGRPATIKARSPGASAITLNAVGDGCGGLESQTVGGAQLTQTDAVGAFGECLLTAGSDHRRHHRDPSRQLHRRADDPGAAVTQLVGGWFQPGDPPAATAGAPVILRIDAPEEVVSGGIAELRIEFADPAFAASVDTVYVKVPSSAGYNGYSEGPARAKARPWSPSCGSIRPSTTGALEQFAWRRSAADDTAGWDWWREPKQRRGGRRRRDPGDGARGGHRFDHAGGLAARPGEPHLSDPDRRRPPHRRAAARSRDLLRHEKIAGFRRRAQRRFDLQRRHRERHLAGRRAVGRAHRAGRVFPRLRPRGLDSLHRDHAHLRRRDHHPTEHAVHR